MENVLNLFKGDNLWPAIAVAVATFVLGMIFELVLVKCCGCKCRSGSGGGKKKPQDRDQPRQGRGERIEKRHPAPADGSIEIYVGNLSYDLTEDQLRAEFEKFGKVNSARIITDKFRNRSKGFGFIHMPNRAEADAACAALNDREILGRKIKCNEAKNVG